MSEFYCFRGDCECDLDIDEAYQQGYNEAIEDFAEKILSTYGSYDSMDVLELAKSSIASLYPC